MTTIKVKEQLMSLTISNYSVKRAVKSYTMSKRYINTMLRATIINILYHRLDIEEKEFVSKEFNAIPFKTFRPRSKNLLIRDFHKYMTACKDALDKNYLREFYLYFVNSESQEIIENYKFVLNYCDQQENKVSQNEQNLAETTCELLRNLGDLKEHGKLNTDIQIKVELTYVDETPEDYEPPGFRGINKENSLMKKLDKRGNSIMLGALFTGFHELKCRGRGDIFNFNESDLNIDVHSEGKNEETKELTTKGLRDVQVIENYNNESTHIIDLSDTSIHNKTSGGQNYRLNDTYISQYIDLDMSDNEESDFKCICELPRSVGEWVPETITCDVCKMIYHAPCQGYIDKTFLGPSFRCRNCEGNQAKDDEGLMKLLKCEGQSYKPICRLRFILACAYKLSKIPKEVQLVFNQTTEKLQVGSENGNKTNINLDLLKTLFNFGQKKPDPEKLTFNN